METKKLPGFLGKKIDAKENQGTNSNLHALDSSVSYFDQGGNSDDGSSTKPVNQQF